MPSVSAKQARTMSAIAHGWTPSDPKVGKIPVAVAKEFNQADAAKKQPPESPLTKALRGGK